MAGDSQKNIIEGFRYLEKERFSFFSDDEWGDILELLQDVQAKKEVGVRYRIKRKDSMLSVHVYVVAPDWAGLVDSVAGILHVKGYNLKTLVGFVNEYNRYGVVYARIDIETPHIDEEEVKRKFESILPLLKVVAKGGTSIERLLYISAFKLEVYEKIARELSKIATHEELKDILREDGELERFVVSRSEAYLREREPKDLAEQVLTNFRFQRELRKMRRGVLVKVGNLKTTREELTCISVAGFDREISLDDVLESMRGFIPDFQRKYDKQFVTDDGIAVIRVEFTDKDGNPLDEDELNLLAQHVKNQLSRIRRREYMELKAGTELIGRVLIPRLIEEAEKSGRPQVYLLPGKVTKELAEFKLAVVAPITDELGGIKQKIIDTLSKVDGIYVTSAKATSQVRGLEIDLFNVKAETGRFDKEEEIYDAIRDSLDSVLGKYRDFDEGMRRLDRRKLEEVLSRLKDRGIDPRFIRHYFYEMDDFYRISTSPQELADEIAFAYTLLKNYLVSSQELVVDGVAHDAVIHIGVAGPRELIDLHKIFSTLVEFDPLITRVEEYGAVVVVFDVRKRERMPSLKEMIDKVKKAVKIEKEGG